MFVLIFSNSMVLTYIISLYQDITQELLLTSFDMSCKARQQIPPLVFFEKVFTFSSLSKITLQHTEFQADFFPLNILKYFSYITRIISEK